MAKLLCVLAQRGFQDDQLKTLRRLLEARGIDVDLVASGDGRAIGSDSLQLPLTTTLADVAIHDYDGLVLVGGQGVPEHLWGNRDVMQLVAGSLVEQKPVVTIGHATAVAAQATVLVGRDAACPADDLTRAELIKHHARPTDLAVVETDTGVITVRDADGLEEAIHLLAERLGRGVGAQAPA